MFCLYLNSMGFGYCDDVANVLSSLCAAAGYQTRVWELNGHVVCEVYNNGRWELYDADLRTLYVDHVGNLVGVEYFKFLKETL